MDVPVLDLSLSDADLVPILHYACSKYGFFYIKNHGIETNTLQNVLEQSKQFFALPLEEKEQLSTSNSPHFRGYTTFHKEKLNPTKQSKGGTKEGFYLGSEPNEEESPGTFFGPNQWPDANKLPEWKNTMEDYKACCHRVCFRILQLLGQSIALCDPTSNSAAYDFTQHFKNPLQFLRLLHYNEEVSDEKQGIFGCGAHTDYGMLTLLLTDEVPALQILPRVGSNSNQNEEEKWLDIPPRKNGFIVNLGDMLERWSNNKYKSTLHRVVNVSGKERYSIPFFFEPDFDTLVTCLPCCTSINNPAHYEPITSGDYLISKYQSSYSEDFTNKDNQE